MTSNLLPFPASQDRAREALAEVQRIQSALQAAGLNLAAHHGVTDEGQAWLSFCDPESGDEIVHVSLDDNDRPQARGVAFITAFKRAEIAAGATRLLRILKKDNRALENASHFALALTVLLVTLQIADSDAYAAFLDQLDDMAPVEAPALTSVANTAVLAQLVEIATDTLHRVSQSPESELEAPERPATEDTAQIDGSDFTEKLRTAHVFDEGAVPAQQFEVPDSVDLIGVAMDLAAEPVLLTQAESGYLDLEIEPFDMTGSFEPQEHVSMDDVMTLLKLYVQNADDYSTDLPGGEVTVSSEILRASYDITMSDGSQVSLIGSDDGAPVEIFL